jgi:hypothetical protein
MSRVSLLVTPTKVGVQLQDSKDSSWIPAFAGMTIVNDVVRGLDPRILHPERRLPDLSSAMSRVSLRVTPTKVGVQLKGRKFEAGFRLSPE